METEIGIKMNEMARNSKTGMSYMMRYIAAPLIDNFRNYKPYFKSNRRQDQTLNGKVVESPWLITIKNVFRVNITL